jgi:hypothetical protein
VTFRPTRLSSILNEQNTFSGAYGLHPRDQVKGNRRFPVSSKSLHDLRDPEALGLLRL